MALLDQLYTNPQAVGDLGFNPMSQNALGLLGIQNPFAMQFTRQTLDQPIMPFGMAPMPRYGYQLQQDRMAGQQNQQPQQPMINQNALQQQLIDMGLLVPNNRVGPAFASRVDWSSPYSKSLFGNQYITPFEANQNAMYGPGSWGYGG